MSALRLVELFCDGCDEGTGEQYAQAGVAREEAQADDWHRSNGHDVCPFCWEVGVR